MARTCLTGALLLLLTVLTVMDVGCQGYGGYRGGAVETGPEVVVETVSVTGTATETVTETVSVTETVTETESVTETVTPDPVTITASQVTTVITCDDGGAAGDGGSGGYGSAIKFGYSG